jgi:hypothetical protein
MPFKKEKMIDFLIKSTISLRALAMYHLVLEKEKYISSIGSTSYPVYYFHLRFRLSPSK